MNNTIDTSAFIRPIQLMSLDQQSENKVAENNDGSMFKDIFSNAVNDVKEKEADLQYKQYLLATGQIDDAHTVPLAASEAQLSVNMLVQLRNKTLDAYNELMRITL